ncbi:MAG: glycyl-radical enzyme activating protein, partial [Bacteroidetes bacterium]|nr:glycyl-radical enzyme activating protein [Bacteroidota bacterium]
MRGTIFNIMRFAVNDGPGIRTTVFLKGCPLSCWWCHNPEGLNPGIQVTYRAERCILCGSCIDRCPQHALQLDGTMVKRDDLRCLICGSCADECYLDARQVVGREIDTEELLAEVLKDRKFYDESGGGVTFSGGEPLLQHEFLVEVLEACKAHGLHTAIETSGLATREQLEEVRRWTDLFLFDVKLIDEERHKYFTGWSNVRILENLNHLVSCGASVVARVPLIPGVNDDDTSVNEVGRTL